MPGPRKGRVALAACLLCLIASGLSAGQRRRAVPAVESRFCDSGSDVVGITVPPDFCLRKFADAQTPRVLLFAPNGDILVSSPKRVTPGGAPPGLGGIFLFRENDPGTSPARYTFAQGSDYGTVHGLLIAQESLYYTVEDAVYRVPYTADATTIDPATPIAVASLGTTLTYARFTHSLALATDGTMYVTRGQFDNQHCPVEDDRMGSVLRVGGNHPMTGDVVVRGLRNPLTLRCMPWGACYAVELSGDGWDAVGGTEKLFELHDGANYGYPCCVKPGIPNPELTNFAGDCSKVTIPEKTFPLHNTPFGFDWERDFGWPDPYRGAFFVGLHGDYANWAHAGLQWASTDPVTHLPAGNTIDFVTGVGRGKSISRIADVRFAPDGRLFFTDDQGGAIYWIAPRTLTRLRH